MIDDVHNVLYSLLMFQTLGFVIGFVYSGFFHWVRWD